MASPFWTGFEKQAGPVSDAAAKLRWPKGGDFRQTLARKIKRSRESLRSGRLGKTKMITGDEAGNSLEGYVHMDVPRRGLAKNVSSKKGFSHALSEVSLHPDTWR